LVAALVADEGMPRMSDVPMDLSSVVAHVDQQVSAAIDDEIVVLNMNDSKYYGLDGISAFIWRSIEQSGRVSTIVDAVLEHYEVSRESCEEDVLAFLHELRDAGLIRIVAS
jgi:hypothetical protein